MKKVLLISSEVFGWILIAIAVILLFFYYFQGGWLTSIVVAVPGSIIVALSRKYRRRISDSVRCPKCNSSTKKPAQFCPNCGAKLWEEK